MGGRGGSSGLSSGKQSGLLKSSGMPQLTGSEKQVKWATDIRKQAIEAINDSVKFYENRLSKNPNILTYQNEVKAAKEISKTIGTVLRQISSASKLIESRSLFTKSKISDEISKLLRKYERNR